LISLKKCKRAEGRCPNISAKGGRQCKCVDHEKGFRFATEANLLGLKEGNHKKKGRKCNTGHTARWRLPLNSQHRLALRVRRFCPREK